MYKNTVENEQVVVPIITILIQYKLEPLRRVWTQDWGKTISLIELSKLQNEADIGVGKSDEGNLKIGKMLQVKERDTDKAYYDVRLDNGCTKP